MYNLRGQANGEPSKMCACGNTIASVNPVISARRQTTIANPAPLNPTKKRKRIRKIKRYTELIEVTGTSSCEKRATVSNIRPKDFSRLVHPSLAASALPISSEKQVSTEKLPLMTSKAQYHGGVETHKVHPPNAATIIPMSKKKKKVPKRSSSDHEPETIESENLERMLEISTKLGGIDVYPAMEHTEHLLDVEAFETEDLEEEYLKSQFQHDSASIVKEQKGIKEKVKGRKFSVHKQRKANKKQEMAKAMKEDVSNNLAEKQELNKMKYDKSDKLAWEEGFMQSFLSYLDTAVYCGFLNRGMNALIYYRARAKQQDSRLAFLTRDARPYEILLHGYAEKKNFSKVDKLMTMMQEDGIRPTLQCYAACFECLGREFVENPGIKKLRHQSSSPVGKLLLLIMDMDREITFNDLVTRTNLLSDKKAMVMETIRVIDPSFTPSWPPCPEFGYNCRLLQSLNETEFQDDLETKVIPEQMNFSYGMTALSELGYDPEILSSQVENGYSSPVSGLLSSEQLKKFTVEQLEIELKDCLEVKSIEKRAVPSENILFFRAKLKESQKTWCEVIRNSLDQELQTLEARCQKNVVGNHSMNLYPYLSSLNKEELVELVLQEIRKLAEGSETFSPSTTQLYRELGSRVFERFHVRWKEKNGVLEKVKDLYGKYCDWFVNPERNCISTQPITCTRQAWHSLVHSHQAEGASLAYGEKIWPLAVQTGIGRLLYDIILRDIRVDININRPTNKKSNILPAFYKLFRSQHQGRILKEEVKPHPALVRLFKGAASDTLKFPARCVPMLCPPTPWINVLSGGYLLAKADVIRLPQQAVLQWQRLVDCPTQQLYPALDSLNQLGAVPWKVNKPVLDVVIDVFNSGGSSHLSIPAPPSSFTYSHHLASFSSPRAVEGTHLHSQGGNKDSQEEKSNIFKERMYMRRKRAEAYSLWCDMVYRLSLANHFRDRIFWLPHNMDFRGRVYPCPPHLNHLGSDVARSLLCFARGQPLGPKGLDWLKLHLVNLTGTMKRNPISERMAFAEEIMPEILDSAEKPLTGRMWWSKSEEPWQTLAACIEISSALKAEGGPENYICHFPVHQDGSCNGLQHYAALGRDAAGAASVSLVPSECPQDVYGVVASMVEKERATDAENGTEIAKVLDGFVRRKVIKQTVMTTVYGVTKFGARLQIARQLKDIEDFPQEHVWRASSYLVMKTFDCLREMFTSTKAIQDWFTECARLIAQVRGQSVEWITPLGLPVVQPYSKYTGSKRSGINDLLRSGNLKGILGSHERPNVMKQKNAFPPNFIHSIDSSHMMLTSLWCERKGLTFVSVHDCYWTHPSTVETMNQVCREQFVSLHSDPILEDLSTFLVEKYSYPDVDITGEDPVMDSTKRKLNDILTQVPQKGNFNLNNVLDSVYFFS